MDLLSFAHVSTIQNHNDKHTLSSLGIARGGTTTTTTTTTTTPSPVIATSPTWTFDPYRGSDTHEDTQQSQSQQRPAGFAFGMGKRSCPAASLSLECLNAIVVSLLVGTCKENDNDTTTTTTMGYTWTLTHPQTDRTVRHDGSRGWMDSVMYTPTLTYPNPIYLTFTQRDK